MIFFQEVDVVCGNDGYTGFLMEPPHTFTDGFLLGYAVIHHFQIKVAISEQIVVIEGSISGFIPISMQQCPGDFSRQTRGRGHQSFVVLLQQFIIDSGFIIEPLDISLGCENHQVSVALFISRIQNHVVAFRTIAGLNKTAADGDVNFRTYDGIDSGAVACLFEV